jgi:hypothetical protein
MFAGPLEITIDRAVAYWLADREIRPLGPESDRTLAPFALVLKLVADGADPDDLVLMARLDDGVIFGVGSGIELVDLAEAAAGIPARPRVIRE